MSVGDVDWADKKVERWFNDPGGEVMMDDCAKAGLAAVLREVRDECVCSGCGSVCCHEREQ